MGNRCPESTGEVRRKRGARRGWAKIKLLKSPAKSDSLAS